LIGGMVGSRLMYVLLYDPAYYLQAPQEFLILQDGGMIFYGGIVLAYFLICIWSWVNNLHLQKYLDLLVPGLSLALVFASTGIMPEGKEAGVFIPWVLDINGNKFHLDQAYYIVFCCLLFVVLWKKRGKQGYYGEMWVFFLIGLGLIDLLTGFFRGKLLMIDFLEIRQVAGIVAILWGILYWHTRRIVISSKNIYQFNPTASRVIGRLKTLFLFVLLTLTSISMHFYFIYHI